MRERKTMAKKKKKSKEIKVDIVISIDKYTEDTVKIALDAIRKIEKDRKGHCGQLNVRFDDR